MSLINTLSTLRTPSGDGARQPMVDLAFALAGDHLPHGYAFALEEALVERLPWLAEESAAGVHPVRAPETVYGLVLSRRTRLVLRIPAARVAEAGVLTGQRIEFGGAALDVGAATPRPIEAFATLRAWNVASAAEDEAAFREDIAFQLEVLGMRAQLICGKREIMSDGARSLAGFGLALHELSPAHSLLLQAQGLGTARRLGCGIFVHHKIIEGLGVDPD